MVKKLLRQIKVAVINSSLDEPYHSYGDHWVDGFEDAGAKVDVFRYEAIPTIPLKYDLYFFVEVRYNPADIPWCLTPRVLYSWDAHIIGHEFYKKLSPFYDRMCLASKIDVDKLTQDGVTNAVWVPEACNPRLHIDKKVPRKYEVGFVGRHNETYKREGLCKSDFINFIINSKYRNFFKTEIWGKPYVDLMNQALISFDRAISYNIGTRVFESAAMGCVPLWSESGISDFNGMNALLTPWKHYVPYNDTIEDLVKVVDSLISNLEKVEQISWEARNYVLNNHTYAHRAIQILNNIGIQMETTC